MATPSTTVWARDPHTGAKHAILRRYLDAWFPIMVKTFPSVTVFDGFAGPGVYSGGEPGSPVIALTALLGRRDGLTALGKTIRFVFVEADERRAQRLEHEIAAKWPTLPRNVQVRVHHGRCEDVAERALTDARAWGQPIFANLDPFNAYIPYSLVKRLGANKSSEMFATLMSDWLRRFYGDERIAHGDLTFGDSAWRRVHDQSSPEDKEAWLLTLYRDRVAEAGLDKAALFKLIDEGGHAFWLVYATSHPLGLEKMKDAMWDVDPVQGYRFRDPRDVEQGFLFDSDDWQPAIEGLGRLLLERLRESGRRTVEELKTWTLLETVYKKPHTTMALTKLMTDGALLRSPERGRLAGDTTVWAP